MRSSAQPALSQREVIWMPASLNGTQPLLSRLSTPRWACRHLGNLRRSTDDDEVRECLFLQTSDTAIDLAINTLEELS